MHPGDFIITPSWAWHDHGNLGDEPVIWMDGLDIPLVRQLDAGFAERYPEETQPVSRAEGDAMSRYGTNMVPVDYEPHVADQSVVFVSVRAQSRRCSRRCDATANGIRRTGSRCNT